jgi:SAM-dependent methyltransferase
MTEPDPIQLCLQGAISAEVAIARLLLAGDKPETIHRRVRDVPEQTPAWTALATASADPARLLRLRALIDDVTPDHAAVTTPAAIAALFDQAVAASPEASVALYSLGDPAILAAATQEIVAWLANGGLIGPGRDVLDLGCGIGRMAAALAPRVRSVLGIDVSTAMLREAERRCAGLPNVRLALTGGTGLAGCPDAAFDLVLAVDSFPYLMQAKVAERHVADSHRVLRGNGTLAVLNLSYRASPGQDSADAGLWADRYGFSLACAGRPFRLWDAAAFIFHVR